MVAVGAAEGVAADEAGGVAAAGAEITITTDSKANVTIAG